MISWAEADKLARVHAPEPTLLSLYLTVPVDPAKLRGLPARIGELMAAAAAGGPADEECGRLGDEDRGAVRAKVAAHGRDWLGHSVAIFACTDLGLLEVLPLRCEVPERAVLAARPHMWPLLAALQRCPAYRVAVVDRRHAWLFSVTGDEIETVTTPAAAGVPSPGFGGWYGLDTYRIQHRIIELTRHHYRDTAALLEQVMRQGEQEPLVIGGHEDGVRELMASVPPAVREAFAGSFTADPHTLTPARVRDLAGPVIARWTDQGAQRLADGILETPPGGPAAIGLPACLAAVNGHAVEQLVVPDDGLVPGYVCGRCGLLGVAADGCPDWETAAQPVPDLIDEMVHRTLQDGGQFSAIRAAPFRIAARLRFPVTGQ
jgi:peptide chain release factor subunit 1